MHALSLIHIFLILTLLVLSGQVLFGSFGVLLSGQPLKIAIQYGFSLKQVGRCV